MDGLKQIMKMCIDILIVDMNIFGFSFSLFDVLILSIFVTIVVKVYRIFSED